MILSCYRSYKKHGTKFKDDWTSVFRSIIVVVRLDQTGKKGVRSMLIHMNKMKMLGKAAELNCVQISELVVKMKQDMTPNEANRLIPAHSYNMKEHEKDGEGNEVEV